MNEEKKTSKGWRVGDRVAWMAGQGYGAVILEVVDRDLCRVRFDDDSVGKFDLHAPGALNWRRLRSTKITFKRAS